MSVSTLDNLRRSAICKQQICRVYAQFQGDIDGEARAADAQSDQRPFSALIKHHHLEAELPNVRKYLFAFYNSRCSIQSYFFTATKRRQSLFTRKIRAHRYKNINFKFVVKFWMKTIWP